MMRRVMWAAGFTLWIAGTVFGCRSVTPPVIYYTLSAIPTAASDTVASGGAASVIGIRPVDLPGTINRVQMVIRRGTNQLTISSLHRWADYPDRLVQRIIAENLQVLMPDTRIIGPPWPIGIEPMVSVSINFLELIATQDHVLLNAMWVIDPTDPAAAARSHRLELRESMADSGFDEIAAAHSRALATLSRAVAGSLMAGGDE